MNNEKMGQFIFELRKSNQMTQKDLASQLNITDKAVSKWERGLSCPDISLLPSIADILGVTTGELLNGKKSNADTEDVEIIIDNALQYADKAVKNKAKSIQSICATAFSLLLLAGIVVCAICNMAISGNFTWSLFPISSIVFAWLVFFPVIKFGEKGICGTMIALSVLIVPFLYVLDHLIEISDLILPIGIRMAIISMVFLWIVFALFKILKSRKRIASAITLLLAIPMSFLINVSLSKIISEPLLDVWDIFAFCIFATAAILLLVKNFSIPKKKFL
ncbi:helix-turn-helix domain-containing protein [Oscillibacter sp.]|uniref:helix-turn-helix domain-containing protein n=1 Tax=Oscillibacter sp. TaxID=1945593 RepID=UPI0028AD3E18|nr:helix-turn-helix domain-containing protein [Oscillibacter sp.]